MRKSKKERDAEYLNGPDISTCQRCGDYVHIWHVWGKGDKRDEIVGMICTRCFWTCGEANIFTALSCKFYDMKIRFERFRERRRNMAEDELIDRAERIYFGYREAGPLERIAYTLLYLTYRRWVLHTRPKRKRKK